MIGETPDLSDFDGGRARLWTFTSSHDRLELELENSERTERRYLVLIGCTRIDAPTGWKVTHLRVDRIESGFALRDAGVEVRFAHECRFDRVAP